MSAIVDSDLLHSTVEVGKDAIIRRGTVIAESTVVGMNAEIDKKCDIGERCHIGMKSELEESVRVGNDTIIGPSSTIKSDSVLGNHVRIGQSAVVHSYVTVNDHTKIDSDAIVEMFSTLGSYVEVECSATIRNNVNVGNNTKILSSADIGPHSSIEKGCVIGASSDLGELNFVSQNAKIGANVRSGTFVEFGQNCVVGDGSNLGNCACVESGAQVPSNTQIGIRGAVKADGTIIGTHTDETMRYEYDLRSGKCLPKPWLGISCVENSSNRFVPNTDEENVEIWDDETGRHTIATRGAGGSAISVGRGGMVVNNFGGNMLVTHMENTNPKPKQTKFKSPKEPSYGPGAVVHSKRLHSTVKVGMRALIEKHTVIAKYTKVGLEAKIGADCDIGEKCDIGVRSVLKTMVQVGNHTSIGVMTTIHKNVVLGSDVDVGVSANIRENANVGNNTFIHTSADIGSDSTIGNWCVIGVSCKLATNVTLLEGARLDTQCHLKKSSIVGQNSKLGMSNLVLEFAQIGNNVKSGNLVEFGQNCNVGDGSQLRLCACVEDGAQVPSNTIVKIRGAVKADGTIIGTNRDETKRYSYDHSSGKCVSTSFDSGNCVENGNKVQYNAFGGEQNIFHGNYFEGTDDPHVSRMFSVHPIQPMHPMHTVQRSHVVNRSPETTHEAPVPHMERTHTKEKKEKHVGTNVKTTPSTDVESKIEETTTIVSRDSGAMHIKHVKKSHEKSQTHTQQKKTHDGTNANEDTTPALHMESMHTKKELRGDTNEHLGSKQVVSTKTKTNVGKNSKSHTNMINTLARQSKTPDYSGMNGIAASVGHSILVVKKNVVEIVKTVKRRIFGN